jgi:hypothetical protein
MAAMSSRKMPGGGTFGAFRSDWDIITERVVIPWGRPATMPAKIRREMPLPTPRSVICSPSHITKMEPTAREKAARSRNPVGERVETTTSRPGWFWLWAREAMPKPWTKARPTVR